MGVTRLIDPFISDASVDKDRLMNGSEIIEAPAPEKAAELEAAVISVKEKWQGAVSEGSGFVAVPMSLLRLQTQLNLTATDMIVLVNLLAHWWDPGRAVFPRSTTIAKRMGVAKRTVQRSTHKMITSGLIERGTLETPTGVRRTFQFNALAQKLARDINLSHQLAGKESLGV